MDQSYKILWEGRIHVDELRINFHEDFNYLPLKEMQILRDTFWESEKKKYPYIYDGDILFCDSVEIEENNILVNLGIIKFSFLTMVLRNNMQFDDFRGYFAFRSKIGLQNGDQLIIGQKSPNSQLDPSHCTFPGGLFEHTDLKLPLSKACQREIYEETGLKTDQSSLLVRAINKHRRNNGCILQIQASIGSAAALGLKANEERANKGLRWIETRDLHNLDYSLLHDDIRYFMKTNYYAKSFPNPLLDFCYSI